VISTLAALASIPTRAHLLPRVLEALRPQVDQIAVYLNGYAEIPPDVRALADLVIVDVDGGAAERKLHWAAAHDGLYLSCDDDLSYPADYVATMRAAVDEWGGAAICTVHGREYEGRPRDVHDVVVGSIGTYMMDVPRGRLVNHGGTGVMAWDARRIKVPSTWEHANMVDMQLAIWAQRRSVPMYLVAHASKWIDVLRPQDQTSLWRTSTRDGHDRRSRLLRTHTNWNRWTE